MSYIGIVGPYAVGKTTASDLLINHPISKKGDVCVINCDNCLERQWESGKLASYKVKAWQAAVTTKHLEIRTCHQDPDVLYICETAWTDHISGAGAIGNVVDFIVLTVPPDVFKQFIIERCAKRNKAFRSDYWNDKRLLYEGTNRPLNAAAKYLHNIRWQHYEIDYERTVWKTVLHRLYADIEVWDKR